MDYERTYKQFLKESGVKDKDMNKSQILTSQTNNSKESISADEGLEEFRKEEEEMHKFFNDATVEKVTNKERSCAVKQSAKQNKADTERMKVYEYTFQDMPECSKESLKIIYHNPIYDLPIPTNLKYKNRSVEERARLLDNYYNKINSIQNRLAKKSFRRAPYSKPILASNKCKNSLLKNAGEEDFFEEAVDKAPSHQFYVSRAGRQIKRKVYTEMDEPDNDSDLEFVIQAKKNKSMISSDTKITIDTPCKVQETHAEPKSVKTMKDAPKRLLKNKKLSRSEEIMEILSRQDETYKKKQQEVDAFVKSLPNEEEEEMFFNEGSTKDYSKVEHDENNKVESTVTQPTESKTEDFDSQDIVPGTPPDSQILNDYMNRSAELRRNRLALRTKENCLSEEKSVEKERDCPLCGKMFPQSEIEDHAANCGNFDNEVENIPTRKSTPRPSKSLPDEQTKPQLKPTTLFTLNEDEEENMLIDDSPVKETKSEENFVRKRIIPPKPINKRGLKPKKQEDLDKIEVMPSPLSSSSASKSNSKRGHRATQSKDNEDVEEIKMDCPICGKQFPQSEIEDHAASCDNFENEDSSKVSQSLKCELCNRLFQKNAQYEMHVNQCIAAKISNM